MPCSTFAVYRKYVDAISQFRNGDVEVARVVVSLGEFDFSDNITDKNLTMIQRMGERKTHRFSSGVGIQCHGNVESLDSGSFNRPIYLESVCVEIVVCNETDSKPRAVVNQRLGERVS